MVGDVRPGDTVFHLRGIPPNARFVGFSEVANEGGVTAARPPVPGGWAFAESFFRADLGEFAAFHDPINLTALFQSRRVELAAYFDNNKLKRGSDKKHLFYVKQSARLQCLNGGYLSEVDEDLLVALFGGTTALGQFTPMPPHVTVETGAQLLLIEGRLGQKKFSDAIKVIYGSRCCFPSCPVTDVRFLVGSHIARWSDNVALRGNLGNGLCFCLMHDKAFELGIFTIDERFRIFTDFQKISTGSGSDFCQLATQHGNQIILSHIQPLPDALLEHWERTGIYPA
jgi:hypothetical protein